jgi:RNA ligase (TIGR02306 family)
MRKLASIQKIKEILPIEGADAIELAIVNGWKVVVAKNVGHKVGDKVIYCEIDSFLPIEPEFEFLRKSSYKKMGEEEGFRLKTIKLRGQVSQGLILPLKEAMEVAGRREGIQHLGIWEEGDDVTELLGILKYEPPIPVDLAGKVKGQFPGFIPKTDEERIQNLTEEFEEWKNLPENSFYVTEKLDGSSATYYYKDGEFGVCSRNLELLETEGNTFWKVAREMNLEEKLAALGKNVSVQGELIGEGIQGNPYKIKGQTVKFFNAFDIDSHEYFNLPMFRILIEETLELETVPILHLNFTLLKSIEDILQMAEGKSFLNEKTEREGLVIRSHDRTISFKAISNKFLLKEK